MTRTTLAHEMRCEASRLDRRADEYDEVAINLRAKAANLRKKALQFDRENARNKTPGNAHPWKVRT